jgi:RNA polymerase sigma factor (TIGR02999 family)
MDDAHESSATRPPITQALTDLRAGQPAAQERLWSLVYGELRRLAARFLSRETNDPVLQPTVLVHEAYLRLAGSAPMDWRDRMHFYRVAATAIRRVIIDQARGRNTRKRGGGAALAELDEGIAAPAVDPALLLDLDIALDRLALLDARSAQVVELRFFAGFTHPEAARILGVSGRAVDGDWQFARSWLHRELGGEG